MYTPDPAPGPIDLLDLSTFAQENPRRPILVILPADGPAEAVANGESLVPTALFGEDRCALADDLHVAIRIQQDLELRAITFHGTTPPESVRVLSVFIGDEPIFTHSEGVPVERFEQPALSRVVEGWRAEPGRDLSVYARSSGPAHLQVSLMAGKRRLP